MSSPEPQPESLKNNLSIDGHSTAYLGDSEVFNSHLIEVLPIAVYTCDPFGLLISFNKAAAELWGREPELGKEYWCGAYAAYTINGERIGHDNSALAQLLIGNPVEPNEEVIIERKDGSCKYVSLHPQLLRNTEGRITGAMNMLLDITERKNAERHSALLTAIIHSTDDAIISKTLDGIITSWNPGAERLFGYKSDEMIGKPITQLIPPDRHKEETHIIERLKKGEHVDHFDTLRLHKNGSPIDISLSVSPVRDQTGKIIGASKVARNITAQKSRYKVLHESERKFRELITQAPVGIVILKGDDLVIDIANSIYLQVIDKKAEDAIGRKLFDVIPETRSYVEEILKQVMLSGEPYYGNEFKIHLNRHGNFKHAYFNFVYHPLRDAIGRIEGVIVVASDVTEQVESKHSQIEAEREFRRRLMDSPVAMTIFRGPDYIIDMANTAMIEKIWKRKPEEVLGKKALEVFPELNDQKYPELLREVLENGRIHSEKASLAYIQHEDELKKFYLDFEYAPALNTEGKATGVTITVYDVTEAVVARQQLEDAEARLRLAAEGTGLATWDLDLLANEIIYTPRLAEIFGYEKSQIIPYKILRSQVHPDDIHDIVEKAFEKAVETGVYYYEARIIRADQSIRWIHTRGHLIYDKEKKPIRMLGTMTDITEQKLASQALQESELRLNIALNAAELGTFELNLNNHIPIYSRRYLEILGYDENEKPTHEELLSRIHPDDKLKRDAVVEEALRTGILDMEVRTYRKDGELIWLKGKGKVFYDQKGLPEKILGTSQDITAQKNAFQVLQESEERFKTVADGAPVMIWMSGTDKFLDFFNTTWLNFTGKTMEQESGEGWIQGVHPADAPKCMKVYHNAFEKKIPFHLEYRLKRFDGIYRWISDNAIPRYTPDGNFIGFISACMDIDDEKRINQRLQESELQFTTISNVSPVGLWMTNDKGENNFVNGTWVEWTGIPLNKQYGGGWLDPLLEEDKNITFQTYLRQSSTRDKFSAEFRFRRADGSVRWALSEGFPYFDTDGVFAGYAGSVSDITERKQSELLKNEFLAVASHELKTPITSIKAYTQLLAKTYQKTDDAFLKNALSKVENQVNKMSKLVGDFLNLSKIESDMFQLNRETFEMNQLAEEAVSDIRMVSPGFEIVTNLMSRPILVSGDREKIMQVLTNLLTNAVKYSPDSKHIDVWLEQNQRSITVFVKDQGIGIRSDEVEKIFQRFYRSDSNKLQVSGFGIGLYISAEIIRQHGGQIGVEKNQSKGSCFYFKLPIAG